MVIAILVVLAVIALAAYFIRNSQNTSVLLEGPPVGAAADIPNPPMPDLTPVEETPAETTANAPQVIPVNVTATVKVATPTTAEAVAELAKANPSPEGATIAPAPKKRGGRRKASAPAPTVVHHTTIINNGANVADDDGLGLAQGMLVGAMIADTVLASQQPTVDPNAQVDTTPDTSGFAPDPGQYDSSASAGGSWDSGSSSSYDSGSSSYDSGSSSFDSSGGGW